MLLRAGLGLCLLLLGGFLLLAGFGSGIDSTGLFLIGGGAVLVIVGFSIFIGRRSS